MPTRKSEVHPFSLTTPFLSVLINLHGKKCPVKKYIKIVPLILFIFLASLTYAQSRNSLFLEKLFNKIPDSTFREVYHHPGKYRLQIIYTQINRDRHNKPSFTNYYFNADSNLYFNPASTVKMPLSFLALQKLNETNKHGVNKYTAMLTDSSFTGQTAAMADSTSATGLPSIAQYIRKVFLISDNDAYNRLYEFLGQQYINRSLHKMGYTDVHITRRFAPAGSEENRHTNNIRFVDNDGKLLYQQSPAYNTDSFAFRQTIKIGKAYLDNNDSLINEPMDFTTANKVSLEDLQQIEQSALFPSSVPANKRFNLNDEDERFLYRYMSQYPSETNYPKYDTSVYYDSYVKNYFKNTSHKIPSYIRIFNKPGWAYGFLTDVSYIADFENKVEFMLSCTLYVNSDGVLNDNKYDYDSIGYPFLYTLGQTIYQYELKRKRKHKPDLGRFIIRYDQRDPNDKRPVIKDADN